MSTNFPTSLDDTTTMPVVIDNTTNVLASHHNNQSDALQAVETKVGTGASTATDGKFLVGNTTAGSSQWRIIAASDIPDISGTYAPAAEGVTNGDTHDHSGGDGAQIAYSSLSGTPTIPVKATGAEINTATDDDKFATSKAIEDSNLARTTDKLSAFAATTSAELAGVISDETGSGKLVFDTSPTLTTPVLGAATATSINGLTITASAGTLTIPNDADAKLITSGNYSTTLTSTAATSVTLPTTGTLVSTDQTAGQTIGVTGARLTKLWATDITCTNSITGNITGNAAGTAATVTGAAQTNITSVGTLTALDVDNININGNTISSTAGTDLNITPLAGQQLVLDGTIEIDAGEVTGITSLGLTGNRVTAGFFADLTVTNAIAGSITGNAATATNIANNTGTTTTVLHGNAAGSPAFGAVVEADITLADNTTNDVSTTKHGFTPKLSNVAGQYLSGTGTWSTPAGSGDVLGPASNTADYLPQWNGADSKTLKDGVAIPTGGLAGLTSPVFTTPQINDTTADHQYITAVSELTADRTVTLPLLTGNDEFTFNAHTQTLTNKTLTSPTINNGTFTGGGALLSKIIIGTRDLTAASGSVSYTGVGFTPTSIIAMGVVQSSHPFSVGFSDSSKTSSEFFCYGANTMYNDNTVIQIATSAGNAQAATVASYGADGFTLSWVKNGSPTGTASLMFLCFR